MITTILSDFSNVILHFRKPSFTASLNGLYRELTNSGKPFNFLEYYEFNKPLLEYYQSLKPNYSINIFTTSQVQNDPKSLEVIDGIFDQILSAEDLGISKTDPASYISIAQKLSKSPEEIVFIDDQKNNVAAAQSAGLKGIQYKSVDELKESLKELLHG